MSALSLLLPLLLLSTRPLSPYPPPIDLTLLNPVLVHSCSSGRPFYAILHRVTRCLLVDFEPIKAADLPMSAAGGLHSYKLAARAIARLQSLPGSSLHNLCSAVVEEVFELTSYDRVMTYRFHDDDHGEVFAEITKLGLDPYLGLHYPATDIPQAARFLFMKNKVQMISIAAPSPSTSSKTTFSASKLVFVAPLCAPPNSCHIQYMENMNSIASLVMVVVVNASPESGRGDADTDDDNQQPRTAAAKEAPLGQLSSSATMKAPASYLFPYGTPASS